MIKQITAVLLLSSILLPQGVSALNFTGGGVALTANPKVSGEPTTAFTFMVWYRATTTAITSTLISATTSGAVQSQTFMRMQAGGGVHNMRCQVNAGGSTTIVNDTGSVLPAGKWHHAWCKYDGATITTGKNGTPGVSAAKTGALAPFFRYAIGGLWGAPGAIYPPHTLAMSGQMAEMMVFNRALSNQELKEYYYSGQINPTGLVHYWPLAVDGADFTNMGSHATSTSGTETRKGLPPTRSSLRR